MSGDRSTSLDPFAALQKATAGLHSTPAAAGAWLIAAAGFVLVINSSWRASPDAALYLGLGESLARGAGYVFNGEPHTFVPPGFPLMVGAAARAFGPSFLVYHVLGALLGIFTAVVGYLLVRRTAGRDVAFFAGTLFALNHALLENSALTLADVPFALFTLIALHGVVYAAHRPESWGRLLIAGLLCAAPALIRVNGVGLVPAAAIYLWCARRDASRTTRLASLIVFVMIAAAPMVGWEYVKSGFPPSSEEGTYGAMVLGRPLGYHARLMLSSALDYLHEITYALTALSLRTGVLESITAGMVLWGAITAWRRGERLFTTLAVIQFGGLLLSPAGARYLLFLLPGLYLFLGVGLTDIVEHIGRNTRRTPRPRTVMIAALTFLAICNIGHNMGTVWSARHALAADGPQSKRDEPFFRAAETIRAQGGNNAVLTSQARILHYLSGAATVSLVRSGVPDQHAFVEDSRVIQALIEKTRPGFLFLDAKRSAIYEATLSGAHAAGLNLTEIPEGSSPPRFFLFAPSAQEAVHDPSSGP